MQEKNYLENGGETLAVVRASQASTSELKTYVSGSWGHWDTQCESEVSYSTIRTRILGISRASHDYKRTEARVK